MKTAFDRPSVQQTKVEVLLYNGKVIGKMITGLSKNHSGATTTLKIEHAPFQKESIVIHKTMAGGGMNFVEETKNLCLTELIRVTDNEEFVKDKLQQQNNC